MSEEKDYTYYSEALHSSYLFYTMEVDKLNKQNKRLREALEKITTCKYSYKYCCEGCSLFEVRDEDNCFTCLKCCKNIAKQALGE